MSESSRIVLPAPTGAPSRAHALPAARPASLEGARLLLIDNGQVQPSLPRYGPLVDWLAEDLEAAVAGLTIERRGEDLIQFQEDELASLRAEILEGGYGGLVIAVCHAGVTASSTVLSLSLEREGLPCVLLATGLGGPLAATMAAHDVPGLPVIEVPWLRGMDGEAVADSRAERAAAVVAALTTPPERLAAAAADNPAVGDPAAGLTEIEVADADASAALYERLEPLQLGDGFPVVAPTGERVEAMLAASPLPPDETLIGPPMPSGSSITVRNLAINAVLAGCRPAYFPVVLAAVRAMAAPEYRFFHTAITTHPGGVAMVVSGPIAEELGIASGRAASGRASARTRRSGARST